MQIIYQQNYQPELFVNTLYYLNEILTANSQVQVCIISCKLNQVTQNM